MAQKPTKADLVLHPVRFRIIRTLSGRELTAQQLGELLPDVPPATLYRHIGVLHRGGILAVAAERRVRGAVERVYALPAGAARLTPAEVRAAGPEEHRRYFLTFIATVLDAFEQYLQREDIDPIRDGVGYSQVVLTMSDGEYARFAGELEALLTAAEAARPAPGRRRRLFTRVVVLADERGALPPAGAESAR